MSRLDFKVEVEAGDTRARAGFLKTLHGEVRTPVFMPVGTQATVKSQTVETLKTAGSSVLLANTYHLLLRPGPEVFDRLGGIHRFMNWSGSVLTDSGGFQIFSLPNARKMTEEGARFRSYVDGREFLLSPEFSIQIQKSIRSDIMMALDQCIPSTAPREQAEKAMHLTHRWAKRSLLARGDSPQSLFGIVQGACFPDLRKVSAAQLTELPFDGFAIGGLAVGEGKNEREDLTEYTATLLPKNLPRYLMGVGTPIDILEAVHRGVDMFDCILPSALAQRGVAFTSQGKLQLRRAFYKFSEETLDSHCNCGTCAVYSKAYLHHLVKADEILGWHLLALHNISFYHQLMREMREALFQGNFLNYYREKREVLVLSDGTGEIKKARKRKKDYPTSLGNYELLYSIKGFWSIRHRDSGEIMHSVSDPAEESEKLYIEQSKLRERITSSHGAAVDKSEPVVVWDVGLGAAHNAMAVVKCFETLFAEQKQPLRPVRIISFENDLDSLKLALLHPGKFPHVRHRAPHELLEKGEWKHSSGLLSWELKEGDFENYISEVAKIECPDLIYYDLFSSKTNGQVWGPRVFQKVFDLCKKPETSLYTYTISTAARASLLSVGFYVKKGIPTGPKEETTVAFKFSDGKKRFSSEMQAEDPNWLSDGWLSKWKRSGARFPFEVMEKDSIEEREIFSRKIENHPQFFKDSQNEKSF